MAQINVEVNGRPYAVGCEDGQEAHLIELAKMFDHQVRQVGHDMGQLGDTRLFLMGALLLADELADGLCFGRRFDDDEIHWFILYTLRRFP
jgi:cell division protein ZapA